MAPSPRSKAGFSDRPSQQQADNRYQGPLAPLPEAGTSASPTPGPGEREPLSPGPTLQVDFMIRPGGSHNRLTWKGGSPDVRHVCHNLFAQGPVAKPAYPGAPS
jgi:hypothetical protein